MLAKSATSESDQSVGEHNRTTPCGMVSDSSAAVNTGRTLEQIAAGSHKPKCAGGWPES